MKMINAKSEFLKFLGFTSIFLLIVFIVLMVQNVIRYANHYTYDPWISVLYLLSSLLIFIALTPVIYSFLMRIQTLAPAPYWFISIFIAAVSLIVFFFISNGVLFLSGFYESFPDELYVRRYFGREALFHLLVIGMASYYIRSKVNAEKLMISGTLGRKEITIQADIIKWIEADDHYLRIYTPENALMKRTTMEQMAAQLEPDFIRIHRKFLVNKTQIVGKEKQQRDEYVILKTGERLKVGRSYSPISW